MATASYDKTVRLWSGSTGRTVTILKGHSGVVNVVVFSPDSAKLASAGADETVRVSPGAGESRCGLTDALLVQSIIFLTAGRNQDCMSGDAWSTQVVRVSGRHARVVLKSSMTYKRAVYICVWEGGQDHAVESGARSS